MSEELRLSVEAPEGVTDRYAAASGDENPIHIDEAFAQSVGLPGRILHGLWTAAQVARAAATVAPEGPLVAGEGSVGDPQYALASLSLQFRGMGQIGPDLVIVGSASDPGDGVVEVTLNATQDGTRLIRNARARVRIV